MKQTKYMTPILAMLLCLGFSMSALAGVPDTMTYDGGLSDRDGKLVNTTVEASFRIFDAKTAGTEAWSEPASSVKVVNGHFSHALGSKTSLKNIFDGKTYWLEISLDGSALSPRTPIDSMPYAFRANSAANADTLQAKTPDQIISLAKTGGVGSANELVYDNKTSGLKGMNAQAALDELAERHLHSELSGLAARIAALDALTANMKLQEINSKLGMTFTGVNVHVRSGAGTTSGEITGLGNLIVGYDEGIAGTKVGSHNLVVGEGHTYPNYGGFVAGYKNTISGPFASVSGGASNIAPSIHSTVTGGTLNVAEGEYSTVSGGASNTASGGYSSISGGQDNISRGGYSSISGGHKNISNGNYSSISGGDANLSNGNYSSINGGQANMTPTLYDSVLGK